jgi:aldehyde dehydrogenase (NAD+)
MSHNLQFYIDGAWVEPATANYLDVIDPSNEDAFEKIALGTKADVDKAVAAAKRAFATFGVTSREERLALLRKIVEVYKRRAPDLALAVSREMGAPRSFALSNQVGIGLSHLQKMVETLETFEFERVLSTGSLVVKEPIGVVGMITPWNWPLNQITCKVAPALAAGCTMVLKPSEIAPLDAIVFAEILDEAGVPKGVFNLVNSDGPTVQGNRVKESRDKVLKC